MLWPPVRLALTTSVSFLPYFDHQFANSGEACTSTPNADKGVTLRIFQTGITATSYPKLREKLTTPTFDWFSRNFLSRSSVRSREPSSTTMISKRYDSREAETSTAFNAVKKWSTTSFSLNDRNDNRYQCHGFTFRNSEYA